MGRSRKHHDDDYDDDEIDVRGASERPRKGSDDSLADLDEPSESDYNEWDELDDDTSLNFGN